MALPRIEVVVGADTRQAEAGFDRVEKGMAGVGSAADRAASRVDRMGGRLRKAGGRSSAFGRGIQNASFQLGDFATQVGAGTNASIALGQQLPQLLGGFGILGAVLGAVVAVGVPLVRVFRDMGESGQELSSVLGVLEPLGRSIANSFRAVADMGAQMAEAIINNLDRILITAGTVAAFMAGKWVVGFVAARVATFSLVGALTALRTALIRTGIGALIIAAGELVYQFTRLVRAAGGFGKAIGLVGDVFADVWGRMKQGISLLGEMFQGIGMVIVGAFQLAFGKVASAFNKYVLKPIADGFNMLINVANSLGANIPNAPTPDLGESIEGQGAYNLEGGAAILGSAGRSLGDVFTSPLESVQKIKEVLASIKDEKITLPDILGAGTGDGDGEGGSKKSAMEEQIENQVNALKDLREMGRSTWSALGNFIQQFAGKSKAAAIAVIAIQKGLSIAQIISNTAAAQMRALAELGPVAGAPVAAKIGALGKLKAGLVAATGLAQAASAGGGGGGAGASGIGAAAEQAQSQPRRQSVTNITLQGEIFSRESVEALLVEQLQGEIDRGGRVVFSS